MTIDISSHGDFDFTLGARFGADFPEPVLFDVDPDVGGIRIPTLFLPEPVFRADFLTALRKAGAANIDDYAVRISGATGVECAFSENYRVINIIGILDCADLSRSEYEEAEGMKFFDRLVIDASRAQGAGFFRVVHAQEYMVISQALADQLDLSSFPDVHLRSIPT